MIVPMRPPVHKASSSRAWANSQQTPKIRIEGFGFLLQRDCGFWITLVEDASDCGPVLTFFRTTGANQIVLARSRV